MPPGVKQDEPEYALPFALPFGEDAEVGQFPGFFVQAVEPRQFSGLVDAAGRAVFQEFQNLLGSSEFLAVEIPCVAEENALRGIVWERLAQIDGIEHLPAEKRFHARRLKVADKVISPQIDGLAGERLAAVSAAGLAAFA